MTKRDEAGTTTPPAQEEWGGVRDVCARYKFSPATLWRKSKTGELPPPAMVGNRRIWNFAEIDRHLLANRAPVTPPPAAEAQPPKRPRGRPRKHPLPAPAPSIFGNPTPGKE